MLKRNERKRWLWFLGFVGLFLILIMGLYLRMMSVRTAAFQADTQETVTPVRVQETQLTEVWRTTSFLARVEGGQAIQVRADVGGWVDEIKVVLGEEVGKGQPLIVLTDDRKFFRLKEAEGRLKSARANLTETKRKYDQALTLVEKGIIARDTLSSLANQVTAESSNVDSLEATYNLMKWDVENLSVTSPIEGQVVDVVPDIGQEVVKGDLLVKMVSRKNEKVVVGLEPRWARLLKPGVTVQLSRTEDQRVEETQGVILGVSPEIDSNSGTYKVEARIVDNKYNWWPGEVVSMRIPVELLKDVVTVPRSAVLSDNKDLFVFVYQDGKALKVPVNVTWINDNQGSIPVDMLPHNGKIIVEGHVGLAGGQLVRVVN